MIVCSCNAFTDRDIRDCLNGGAAPERPRDVYTALGCKPQCGCCASTIARILEEHSQATPPEQLNSPADDVLDNVA